MSGLAIILRRLWHHSALVTAGVWLGLAAGVLTAFSIEPGLPPELESRKYRVGVASAAVLVDSPTSQTVDLGGTNATADVASLSARARLLANLLTTNPLKDEIAQRAGLHGRELVARAPAVPGPAPEPTPLDRKIDDRRAHLLTVHVNETLPIITADAQAPTPELAARIASATVAELTEHLTDVAAAEAVPFARQLRAEALGPARSAWTTRGPRRLYAVAVNLLVVALWCAGILMVSSLARTWREAAALEEADEHWEDWPPPDPDPVAADGQVDARLPLVLVESPGTSGAAGDRPPAGPRLEHARRGG